jgi:predicted MFS family arabinose efflux permease
MTARRLALSLGLASFVGLVIMFSIIPLVPSIAEDLDAGVASVGQALTIGALVGAALSLVVGPMGDHYGHRRLLIAGALLATLGTLCSGLAPDYWTFLLSRVPAGLGGSMMGAMAIAIVYTRLPEDERRVAIGWVVTAASMAPIAGFPLVTEIAARSDWRVSMVALSALSLTGALLAFRMLPGDAAGPEHSFRWSQVLDSYKPILRDTSAVLLQVSNILRAAAMFVVFGYIGAYLVDIAGAPLQVTGYVLLAAGIGYSVGSRLGDGSRIPLPLRTFYGLATVVVGLTLAIPFLLSLGWVATAALFVLANMAVAAGYVALTIVIVEESPAGSSTTLMLRQSSFSVGVASGGALGGAVLLVGGFPALAIVSALLSLMAAFTGYWKPSPVARTATGPQASSS